MDYVSEEIKRMHSEIIRFRFIGQEEIHSCPRWALDETVTEKRRYHGLRYDANYEFIWNEKEEKKDGTLKFNEHGVAELGISDSDSDAGKPKPVRKGRKDTGSADEPKVD